MEKRLLNKIYIFVSLIFILALLAIINNRPLEIKTIPTKFTYSNSSAFDIIKGELSFGVLKLDQESSREVNIKNDNDFKVKVKVRSTGETKEFISVSENNFNLNPGEEKDINFILIPEGKLIEDKEYRGETLIYFRKV